MEPMTDTERLDWLERHGGFALVTDGVGNWAVARKEARIMHKSESNDEPQNTSVAFWIEKDKWKNSIREAINRGGEQ